MPAESIWFNDEMWEEIKEYQKEKKFDSFSIAVRSKIQEAKELELKLEIEKRKTERFRKLSEKYKEDSWNAQNQLEVTQ